MCKLILIDPRGVEEEVFSIFVKGIKKHFTPEPHFQIAMIHSGHSELKDYRNQLLLELISFEKNSCFVHKPINVEPFIGKIQETFHGETPFSFALGVEIENIEEEP